VFRSLTSCASFIQFCWRLDSLSPTVQRDFIWHLSFALLTWTCSQTVASFPTTAVIPTMFSLKCVELLEDFQQVMVTWTFNVTFRRLLEWQLTATKIKFQKKIINREQQTQKTVWRNFLLVLESTYIYNLVITIHKFWYKSVMLKYLNFCRQISQSVEINFLASHLLYCKPCFLLDDKGWRNS